jgi:hypothetical protein
MNLAGKRSARNGRARTTSVAGRHDTRYRADARDVQGLLRRHRWKDARQRPRQQRFSRTWRTGHQQVWGRIQDLMTADSSANLLLMGRRA